MPRPLLIDTDPGCDDALALLLALERDELDVVGLSTVHGNASLADTTRNARSLLECFDRTDVPLAKGATLPLTAELETAEHIHGAGGIRGELPEPTSATEPLERHSAQFIVEKAREYDGELTLAAIGPLTNVALALAIEPDLPDLLDELIVMGGAAFVPGNVTPLAEANFRSDPEAAARVVRDAQPTIVGLDVTNGANVPGEWIDSLPESTALGRSVVEWFTYYSGDQLEQYEYETTAIHDALAIAGLVDESVLETERYHMQVGTDSDLDRGALVCDATDVTDGEPNGSVALEADFERYRELLTGAVERTLETRADRRA
ncbi:nucleoside hydrolase [Halostagnicola kamekurae]|uniref:Purine nucleosidase n=1 Tax=Halostagnicola kamekurae TaxID=619731 RepID=A0A1I6S123_9EURY|nr:nucleoside hydrolase [Halostagnicola kamekurae]SFS70637.1 purine nucleosidase [Halostagnicola kamekurae]